MKKIFLILLMVLTMSGCSSSNDKNTLKIGTLTQLNSTPEQAEKFSNGGTFNFYDNFNSMQMALASENINVIQTYGSVAKYMVKNNSDFKISTEQTVTLVDNFCCAMRKEDVALKNSFDEAISAMKADGTLNNLIDEYVDNASDSPQPVAMEKFDGAQTIRVGVTGDLPPLDYVMADGTPAGFNTAVLSEIGKRIGKNIEIIQIDSGTRAAALMSRQVDVIFWVVVPADNSSRPKDFDVPEGVAVTDYYYQDNVADVSLNSISAAF